MLHEFIYKAQEANSRGCASFLRQWGADTLEINMKQIDKFFFIIISIGLAILVIYKGITIPITHDESAQITFYAQQSIKDIFLYVNPWPTNHILNSLLIKASTQLFGMQDWSGRLPNFISFILLLMVLNYWIFKLTEYPFIIKLALFVFLLFNPFVFDFFSLARGYGMAICFQIWSMFLIVQYFKNKKNSQLVCLQITLLLMVASNFSWLIFWAAIMLVLGIYFIIQKNIIAIAILFISALVMALFCYHPLMAMQSTNQFQYWSGGNWFQTTFFPLWHLFLYDEHYGDLIYISASALLFFSISAGIYYFLKSKKNVLSFIWIAILASIILINILQHFILKTPYLTGRTALLYYPIISIIIVYYFIFFLKNKMAKISLTVIVLFSFFHFYKSFKFKSVKEWNFDAYTFEVLNKIEQIHNETNAPVQLDIHWLFHPSFHFYKETKKLHWLQLGSYHKEPNFDNKYMYYYTIVDDLELAKRMNYEKVFDINGYQFLLKKK